jgi:hypothetical protein
VNGTMVGREQTNRKIPGISIILFAAAIACLLVLPLVTFDMGGGNEFAVPGYSVLLLAGAFMVHTGLAAEWPGSLVAAATILIPILEAVGLVKGRSHRASRLRTAVGIGGVVCLAAIAFVAHGKRRRRLAHRLLAVPGRVGIGGGRDRSQLPGST